MLELQKMNDSNIMEMCRIADATFFYVGEKPSIYFKKVHHTEGVEFNDEDSMGVVDWVEYYAIVLNGKTIGTIGLYHLSHEPLDVLWLGWFCVDAHYRGLGYGIEAMTLVKGVACQKNAKILKLYTSNHPEEVAAQAFYERFGFETFLEVQKNDLLFIYKKLQLQGE